MSNNVLCIKTTTAYKIMIFSGSDETQILANANPCKDKTILS